MKYLLLIPLFLVSGCYYSDGCIYSPQMVNCYVDKGKDWPYIAYFQKKGNLGNTNAEQRWQDVRLCGGINISKETNNFQIKNEREPDGSINIIAVNNFESCMLNKGYKRLYSSDCGTQHPKWDKGKCNL